MLLGQANRLESNTDGKPTATSLANNKTSKNPFFHNMGRGKTNQKGKTVNMKKESGGERWFGWASSADSEPQTGG
jgi:hypothetical protein